MAKKLVKLNIEHIAGVTRAANKRQILVMKTEKEEPVNKAIRKEGDKFCLYDADGKKLGTFDSEEDAKAAQMKMNKQGATMSKMLKKEQIAKIGDEEIQTAIIEQQEEMTALEKKVKELEETVVTLKANAPTPEEELWKGIPAALRSRFDALQKERDKAEETAKAEKDARETNAWMTKLEKVRYLSMTPGSFAKVMKNVAEHCPGEAAEIERVLFHADEIIGKGVLFSEIGKSPNGKTPIGDATSVVARVDQMADELMALDPTNKLTKVEAMEKVFKNNPGLHKQYREAEAIRV